MVGASARFSFCFFPDGAGLRPLRHHFHLRHDRALRSGNEFFMVPSPTIQEKITSGGSCFWLGATNHFCSLDLNPLFPDNLGHFLPDERDPRSLDDRSARTLASLWPKGVAPPSVIGGDLSDRLRISFYGLSSFHLELPNHKTTVRHRFYSRTISTAMAWGSCETALRYAHSASRRALPLGNRAELAGGS